MYDSAEARRKARRKNTSKKLESVKARKVPGKSRWSGMLGEALETDPKERERLASKRKSPPKPKSRPGPKVLKPLDNAKTPRVVKDVRGTKSAPKPKGFPAGKPQSKKTKGSSTTSMESKGKAAVSEKNYKTGKGLKGRELREFNDRLEERDFGR